MRISHCYWLAGTVLIVFASKLHAQVDEQTKTAQPTSIRQEISRVVMSSLRDGDVEQALKSLESVAEERVSVLSIVDETGLSSTCGCLHRALSQLSSDQQFELLSKWSMPTDGPQRLRIISAIVPTIAPPAEFVRALGERPRKNSFEISAIGQVDGIFNSGWSLVRAARDCGKLNQLTTKLVALSEKKIPNADLLLALAQIADGRGDSSKAANLLIQWINDLKTPTPQAGTSPKTVDSSSVVLAIASLEHPALRSQGEDLLNSLLTSIESQSGARIRPFLQRAYALAILNNSESQTDSHVAPTLTQSLKYWIPISQSAAGSNSPPWTNSEWLAHDGHLVHLSGSGKDSLLMRYPLTGEFQFQCEVQTDEHIDSDGGITFTGFDDYVLARRREFCTTDLNIRFIGNYFCPFVHEPSKQSFNQLTLTSTLSLRKMALNMHPMWEEKAEFTANPWIGLSCSDEFRPLFRNFKLTGQPVIPRVVQIFDGRQLRGWHPQLYGDLSHIKPMSRAPWSVKDGILNIAKEEAQTPPAESELVISYQRPVLANESVSCEFFYEQGVYDVSPALGRMAFMLHPEGVRIHWITDGNRDWTGLTIDNAVAEPLNRRGPRPLPLKANGWNQLTVARTNTTISLTLNDFLVYERPIDWEGDFRFGFYRSRDSVKLRNVRLTGDWPKALPAEFINNPTMRTEDSVSEAERRNLNRLFKEEILASNVTAIRRKAAQLSAADRFDFLSQWVLPGPDHPGFRVTGAFTPTLPAQVLVEKGTNHPVLGGQFVSPAFDWIDSAIELGRLDECRQKVAKSLIPDTEFQKRAKASLLLLLSLEQGNQTQVASDFDDFFALLKAYVPTGMDDQWPETLVAARGVQKFGNVPHVGDVIGSLYWGRTVLGRPPNAELWRTQIASLFAQWQFQKQTMKENAEVKPKPLKDWIPAVAAKSEMNGPGYPLPVWSRQDEGALKNSGYLEDYLYYRLPLTGDFEVECDHVLPGQNHMLVMIAGKSLGLDANYKNLLVGTLGFGLAREPLDTAFTIHGKSARYKYVVRDGTYSAYINGRLVKTNPLQKPFDPWVAIRSWSFQQTNVQDLRISGKAQVLSEVPLSASKELAGWIDYYRETTTGENGLWTYVPDPQSNGRIVGPRDTRLPGTFKESLLRYQRPLLDDESIEYDFFYQTGKIETNPALDRIAFILTPSGIREHWLTDGRYDQTELSPENITDVVQFRRGPVPLPLKNGRWNHLKCALHEDTLAITLNEQLVYERKMDSPNPHSFGLFHYSDATESIVRDVVMRGNWPKTVPPISEQELASQSTNAIDADLARLKSVFIHDFQKDGLPKSYFQYPANSTTLKIVPTAEGIEINQSGPGNFNVADILPNFSLIGDFDFEAKFSGLKVENCDRNAGIFLGATFDEPLKPSYALNRLHVLPSRNILCASQTLAVSSGGRNWLAKENECESSRGRFRFARRKDQLFYLFADGDSETFQLLDTQKVAEVPIGRNGIQLRSESVGTGRSHVFWQKLSLRAEQMYWHPQVDPSLLESVIVMRAGGQGSKTIANPAKVGFTAAGFPEWSPDGRKIVMGMSRGPVATSHVFVVNSDGSQLTDLGPGCIPSFSPDGSRVVYSHPAKGIMTMNSDGTERESVDPAGWGSQWSPDGKWIAYGKSGNITLLNCETRETRQLLVGEAANRYTYIYAGLGWSHDSRSIAFKARRRDVIVDELAIAEFDADDNITILNSDAANISQDCAFSSDGQQVLVSIEDFETRTLQVYGINCKTPGQVQLLAEQPQGNRTTGCACSPDGSMIVFAGRAINESREWGANAELTPSE